MISSTYVRVVVISTSEEGIISMHWLRTFQLTCATISYYTPNYGTFVSVGAKTHVAGNESQTVERRNHGL